MHVLRTVVFDFGQGQGRFSSDIVVSSGSWDYNGGLVAFNRPEHFLGITGIAGGVGHVGELYAFKKGDHSNGLDFEELKLLFELVILPSGFSWSTVTTTAAREEFSPTSMTTWGFF